MATLPKLGWKPSSRQEATTLKFYGLALYSVLEVIDFCPSRDEAEEALRQVLADEPSW